MQNNYSSYSTETNISNQNCEYSKSDESNKKILITGTNNRYLIKRANRVKAELKKRQLITKYKLGERFLNWDLQLELLKEMHDNTNSSQNCNEKTILKQEIERKINSYKQQDLLKNIYNPSLFIDTEYIIQKLMNCNMQCYYCNCQIVVLYEIVRELKQWSVDRVNNNEGHNKENLVIACLNCNLKRRTTNSNKFLFTKQLNLIKMDE
jgi:hypothetical protein